jgi:hypothetical protein
MSERDTTPSATGRERRPRILTQIGACASAVGIALAAAGDDGVSRWLVLGGVLTMIVGLHRFGRLGADPPRASS